MLKQLILPFLLFFSTEAFSQRIIANALPGDIDLRCNDLDLEMAKNKLSIKQTYYCSNCMPDSCKLIEKASYNIKGQLTKLQIGENIQTGNINCEVIYRQLSDSTYESIAKYHIGAKDMPQEFFLDTVINGQRQKMPLYKVSKDNTMYVRSVYSIDSESEIASIKRYDSDNKLVLIFYPWGGNRVPLKASRQVTSSTYDSIVTHYSIYKENEYKSEAVYNRLGKIKQITHVNHGFEDNKTSLDREYMIYDSRGRIIIKLTVDEDNEFVSQSRWYYGDSSLIRYTSDYDLADSVVNEERIFDTHRKLIFSQTINRYSPGIFAWYYKYDSRGLLQTKTYHENNTAKYCEQYQYK